MISLKNVIRRCFLIAAAISVLGSLYVLSIGPAAWLVKVSGGGQDSVETVRSCYAPIVWFHENTSLKGPLETYVKFFESD